MKSPSMERTERMERTFPIVLKSPREMEIDLEHRSVRSVRSVRSTSVENTGKTTFLNSEGIKAMERFMTGKAADATPAEIAAACLLIHATWTPDERLRAHWRPTVRGSAGSLSSNT